MPSPGASAALRGRKDYFPGASFGADFTRGRYKLGKRQARNPASLPGWTFTRASTGYAETAAGALTSFASGAPRITDKGLLVEEARTNYALRSQEFDNATYIKTNMAVTADDTLAPDGTQTADKVYVSSAAAGTTTYQNVSPGAGTSIAVTLYAKKGTSATTVNEFGIRDVTGAVTLLVFTVNYDTLAVTYSIGASGVTVTQCANGWVRIQMLLSWTSGNTCRVYCGYASGTRTLNDYAYVWGLQVEVGAFPTSYIPTAGAQATRQGDVPSLAVSTSYPATIVASGSSAQGSAINLIASAHNGSATDYVRLYPTTTTATAMVVTSSLTQALLSLGAVTANATLSIAVRVDTNNFGASLNGGAVSTDVAGTNPATSSVFEVGQRQSGANYLNGYIRRAIIYPYAFTDAQLQGATA